MTDLNRNSRRSMNTLSKSGISLVTALGILAMAAFAPQAIGHDSIPGSKQSRPILLSNADVYTVTQGVIEEGDLLFDQGKIVEIGKNLDAPANAEVIDLKGKRIYPGFISANSTLGLVEINAVRATRDYAESGSINPNARSATAINPDSELIPVTRANGVLVSHVLPQGGLISGSSTVVSLEGWTIEEMALETQAGIHIRWPRSPRDPDFHPDAPSSFNATKAEESYQENIRKLDTVIEDARAFRKALKNDPESIDVDLRWESLISLLEKRISAFVSATRVREIRDAVHWAARQDLPIVIFTGSDAWRAADTLKANNVGVILNNVNSLPMRRWESYDVAFANAALLHKKGVRFAIAFGGGGPTSSNERHLPYEAAKAAAHGLPRDEALKAITIYPAQLLGVDDRVGSLEPGKRATLFICDGDPLDLRSQVSGVYIDGREVDLSSRHTLLYEKYKKKYE